MSSDVILSLKNSHWEGPHEVTELSCLLFKGGSVSPIAVGIFVRFGSSSGSAFTLFCGEIGSFG